MNSKITRMLSPAIRTQIELEKDAKRIDQTIQQLFDVEQPTAEQVRTVERLLERAEYVARSR